MQKAFTMLELVFVIVIIGILSAVAIPKFAASRDDATIVKAKATVSAIRSAISMARQKRILRGDFANITVLGSATGYDADIFEGNSSISFLEYGMTSCKDSSARGCWYTTNNITYRYIMPVTGFTDFNLTSNKFTCNLPTSRECKSLTR